MALVSLPSLSQTTVKGILVDQSLGEGEPYATVRVFQPGKSDKAVAMFLTGEDGRFSHEVKGRGKYDIVFSSVGKKELRRALDGTSIAGRHGWVRHRSAMHLLPTVGHMSTSPTLTHQMQFDSLTINLIVKLSHLSQESRSSRMTATNDRAKCAFGNQQDERVWRKAQKGKERFLKKLF